MNYLTNNEFIKKYGKYEFNHLKEEIYIKLFSYKNEKIINGFKLHNTKKYAKIYLNYNGKIIDVILEYAMIYSIKDNEFKKMCILIWNKKQERKEQILNE